MFHHSGVTKPALASQICKNYQNITSNLVFTIVFRIYCNFLIVVPFRFKTCRFNVFFFTRQNICARKSGSAFCLGCVICFSFIAYEDNSILLICYLRHLPVQAKLNQRFFDRGVFPKSQLKKGDSVFDEQFASIFFLLPLVLRP